jgi:hypothetical protein
MQIIERFFGSQNAWEDPVFRQPKNLLKLFDGGLFIIFTMFFDLCF